MAKRGRKPNKKPMEAPDSTVPQIPDEGEGNPKVVAQAQISDDSMESEVVEVGEESSDETEPIVPETSLQAITLPEAEQPRPGFKLVPNLINPEASFEVPIVPTVNEAGPEIAAFDQWRYHNDHQPKIFKRGDPIPAHWQRNQSGLSVIWSCDPFGKWSRKER